MTAFSIDRSELDSLFQALKKRGYEVVGPTLQDQAIVYDYIESSAELPVGMSDEQEAGSYRLKKRSDGALFAYAVGPHAWKKFLHPSHQRLWTVKKQKGDLQFISEKPNSIRYAFIGVRACDIAAMQVQDKVFLSGTEKNYFYKELRENTFIVGVNCSHAVSTCFCTSMQTGPKLLSGFDLSLTELIENERHIFLLKCGSKKGEEVLQELSYDQAKPAEQEAAQKLIENTSQQINKNLDVSNIQELFYQNYEHSHWEDVAERCLSCANCTMVCPTCFCTTVEDVSDLSGDHSERWQKWDSCFSLDFSYTHGTGPRRSSIKSRYRQWLTHKLATWIDQFGSSGCVGCGRCITWCPVGIDLTQEVAALRGIQK
ncbi:MAG: 4Fe-4S dicluster domain-containing protein [Deltaproteobacteria bacterium]|nr:4Fe-4S dicluster domain-containing protein [Deltaproteobacteria bacterium]